MIKILGIMFIFMASACIGIYFSDNIKRKKERLTAIRKMYSEIAGFIRYYSLTMSEIAVKLSEKKEFSRLYFLNSLSEFIRKNYSFPDAWEKSVIADNTLSDDEKKLLLESGSALGTTDTEGQLSALDYYIQQAESAALAEEEKYRIKGKMYRSLGAVFGAMIGILII